MTAALQDIGHVKGVSGVVVEIYNSSPTQAAELSIILSILKEKIMCPMLWKGSPRLGFPQNIHIGLYGPYPGQH